MISRTNLSQSLSRVLKCHPRSSYTSRSLAGTGTGTVAEQRPGILEASSTRAPQPRTCPGPPPARRTRGSAGPGPQAASLGAPSAAAAPPHPDRVRPQCPRGTPHPRAPTGIPAPSGGDHPDAPSTRTDRSAVAGARVPCPAGGVTCPPPAPKHSGARLQPLPHPHPHPHPRHPVWPAACPTREPAERGVQCGAERPWAAPRLAGGRCAGCLGGGAGSLAPSAQKPHPHPPPPGEAQRKWAGTPAPRETDKAPAADPRGTPTYEVPKELKTKGHLAGLRVWNTRALVSASGGHSAPQASRELPRQR
ncbi:uncharacterized protein [Vulpes vulpes]|uniref:Basic proline-rich protein-like n=1 Tax=Vulpes vulpes TaxID=9627 RepID=A0ABM4ZXW5_VULVU